MTTSTPPSRKLFASYMVSLDGFIEGPSRELDWHVTDCPAFADYCDEMLDGIDHMVFGRLAYEALADYWTAAETDANASERDRRFAVKMNRTPKLVLSRTLSAPAWANTRVLADGAVDELAALKRTPGKNIALFAGAGALRSLARAGLIDEYRLIVQPIVLGGGRPMFEGFEARVPMRLTRTATLGARLAVLYYEPVIG